jgi:hypothetical protein
VRRTIKDSRIICRQHPHTANHIDPAYNAMTKIGWPIAQNQFAWMCRRYFCSQEIDSHYATESGSTDNCATVAGCAISATINYLKLHAPTKSNPLCSNDRAKTLNSSMCFEAVTLRIS